VKQENPNVALQLDVPLGPGSHQIEYCGHLIVSQYTPILAGYYTVTLTPFGPPPPPPEKGATMPMTHAQKFGAFSNILGDLQKLFADETQLVADTAPIAAAACAAFQTGGMSTLAAYLVSLVMSPTTPAPDKAKYQTFIDWIKATT
jgi:hypothetical protein